MRRGRPAWRRSSRGGGGNLGRIGLRDGPPGVAGSEIGFAIAVEGRALRVAGDAGIAAWKGGMHAKGIGTLCCGETLGTDGVRTVRLPHRGPRRRGTIAVSAPGGSAWPHGLSGAGAPGGAAARIGF